jgi:hypothetical protein
MEIIEPGGPEVVRFAERDEPTPGPGQVTGHGKAHQPPLPGSPVCLFPVMLLGKAGEGRHFCSPGRRVPRS